MVLGRVTVSLIAQIGSAAFPVLGSLGQLISIRDEAQFLPLTNLPRPRDVTHRSWEPTIKTQDTDVSVLEIE